MALIFICKINDNGKPPVGSLRYFYCEMTMLDGCIQYIPLVCGLDFDSITVSFVKQDKVNEVQFVNIFNS